MSAFMCTDKHISSMVNQLSADDDTRRTLAKILHRANVVSLRARYGDREDSFPDFKFDHAVNVSPVQAIKNCHCFDYQACEDDAYATSEAKAIVTDIVSAACRKLQGYEKAQWGM